MGTAEISRNVAAGQTLELLDFSSNLNTTYLFLFTYSGRAGLYSVNNDGVVGIAPSRAITLNDNTGTYALYVESGKLYFKNNHATNTQSMAYRLLNAIG